MKNLSKLQGKESTDTYKSMHPNAAWVQKAFNTKSHTTDLFNELVKDKAYTFEECIQFFKEDFGVDYHSLPE